MAKTQLIFVGSSFEAAWESLVKFRDSETKKIIGIYSERSKNVWEKIKNIIAKELEIEEYKIDMNNLAEVERTTTRILLENKNLIINATGIPKESFLALLITLLNREYNPDVVMLQAGGQEIRFSPQLIKYAICDINGKTRKFLESIYDILKNDEEIELSQLAIKMKRSKATLSDSLKRMAERKIIIKRREGNRLIIRLNPFAKSMLQIIMGDNNGK
jgi:hypothetical protein